MGNQLYVQADISDDLDAEAEIKLKGQIVKKLEEISSIKSPRVMVQRTRNLNIWGFSVKTDLKNLADNPANGRYLGLFIFDETGKIVSEKFILNPAIKQPKSRFPLVLSFLKQNNVSQILLTHPPSEEQLSVLQKNSFNYRVVDSARLDDLRENPNTF